MSFAPQDHDFRELARAALAELDAPEPDPSPAQLMGGMLAWGESRVAMVEAARDPANAPTMRPHVIAPCQKLQTHPALRLHCACGKGLDFLALASMNGVLVVSSPRRLVPKLRRGGPNDLATVESNDPTRLWAFVPWEHSMHERLGTHGTAWDVPDEHPALGPGASVMGDAAKRQLFSCPACGATHTFVNITLLRMVLRAMANGDRRIDIPGGPRAAAPPSGSKARPRWRQPSPARDRRAAIEPGRKAQADSDAETSELLIFLRSDDGSLKLQR